MKQIQIQTRHIYAICNSLLNSKKCFQSVNDGIERAKKKREIIGLEIIFATVAEQFFLF